jgi:hypothetical protein
MKTYYAQDIKTPYAPSPRIMLCGPTPRDESVKSWRPDALAYLKDKFHGAVFVPEPKDSKWQGDYENQVDWEDLCLNVADCIAFWIPRDLKTLPGFTTNIEWGRWEKSGKVVLGYPEGTSKMTYISYYATRYGVPIAHTLEATLDNAIKMANDHYNKGQQ